MWVKFGNAAPVEMLPDGRDDTPPDTKVRKAVEPAEGVTVDYTICLIDDSVPLLEAMTTCASPANGIIQAHTDAAPTWVMSNNARLAENLAENYGCPVRKPTKADREEMGG